jgi:hypothetical protein
MSSIRRARLNLHGQRYGVTPEPASGTFLVMARRVLTAVSILECLALAANANSSSTPSTTIPASSHPG